MGHIIIKNKTFKDTQIKVKNADKKDEDFISADDEGEGIAKINFPTGTKLIFINIDYYCYDKKGEATISYCDDEKRLKKWKDVK